MLDELLAEKAALDERRRAMFENFAPGEFDKLPIAERKRLIEQSIDMKAYSDALGHRINYMLAYSDAL